MFLFIRIRSRLIKKKQKQKQTNKILCVIGSSLPSRPPPSYGVYTIARVHAVQFADLTLLQLKRSSDGTKRSRVIENELHPIPTSIALGCNATRDRSSTLIILVTSALRYVETARLRPRDRERLSHVRTESPKRVRMYDRFFAIFGVFLIFEQAP